MRIYRMIAVKHLLILDNMDKHLECIEQRIDRKLSQVHNETGNYRES
jgi:hypothetical protein